MTSPTSEHPRDEISRRARWVVENTPPFKWDVTRTILVMEDVYVVVAGDLFWVEVVVERPNTATIPHMEGIYTNKYLSCFKHLREKAVDELRARMVLDDLADI